MPRQFRDCGLSTVQLCDPLWHMKLNRNLAHIDANLIGQCAAIPATGVVFKRAVVLSSGSAVNGCTDTGFFGVAVREAPDSKVFIQIAGATVCEVANAAAGMYAYAADDGSMSAYTLEEILTGDMITARIVGIIVLVNPSGAHVLVRSKYAFDRVPYSESIPSSELFAGTSAVSDTIQCMGVFDAQACTWDTNYGFATVVKDGTGFTVTVAKPFTAMPIVRVGLQLVDTPAVTEFQYLNPTTIHITVATAAGSVVADPAGKIHITAMGNV